MLNCFPVWLVATALASCTLSARAALVHYLPLDGDLSDPVGGISGTLNSGVWVSGAPSGPTPSGGLKFSGIQSSFATLTSAALLGLNDAGTVMAWVKRDANAGSNWFMTLGGGPFTFLMQHNHLNFLWVEFKDTSGSSNLALLTTASPPLGEWHHIALAWDLTQVVLYVDGTIAASWGIAGPSLGRDSLFLGSTNQNGDRVFDGVMDEVRVYDNFLDEAGVQAGMTGADTSPPPPSGGFVSIDAGSDVSLVLTGEPGVAYNVDWASNIWDESWTYSGLSVTGSSNPVQVVDSDAQWNEKYYRLSLQPPEAIPGAFNHDFREGTLNGWTDTEDAFIATQDNQGLLPWKGDYHLWAHEYYASSDTGTATGSLKSAVFTIPTSDRMTFYVAGWDGSGGSPIGNNAVRLVRAGDQAVLFERLCPQTTRWTRVWWELWDQVGTDCYIEVVDGNDSASDGWIAVDDFEMGADQVLSPWSPVTVTGDTVNVWGRSYGWNSLPVPDEVESLGTPLLAGPIRLNASVSSQPVVWTPVGAHNDAERSTASGVAATIRRSVEGSNVRIDGIAITEFDGMMRIELTVSPVAGVVTLNHLYMEIPFDSAEASLMYLYYVPFYGERTAGAAASFSGPFHPICWLGNEERGLMWFSETDARWRPQGNANAVQVIPGAQETVLQLRIWDQPYLLNAPVTISMGLQATPVKPLPADWHQRSIVGNVDWYGNEGYGSLRLQDLVNQDVKVISSGENWAAIQNYPEAWCCRQELLSAKKLQSSGTIPAGVWKHVAASWDADTRQAVLYIDGVAADQINDFVGLVSQPDRPFVIGGDMNVNQSRQFDGIMDEVRVYDRFLSAPEVMQAMSAAIPAGPGGLVHGYAFEESGTTVLDSVGSENGAFGTAKTTGDWTTGRYGGGLRFRATSPAGGDFVDFGTASSFDLIKEGSVMAWIYEMTQDSESFFMQKGREVNFSYMLTSSTYWNSMTLELSTGSFYCPCEDPADDSYGELVDQIHAFGLKTIPYFGFLYADIAPEYDLYSAECFRTPQSIPGYKREASGGTPPQESFDVCNRSRYTDLLLDGVELVRDMYGVDGVYLDATTLGALCQNQLHGCGYIAGSLRGTYPIFPTRTLMKRLSELFPEDQGGIIEAHTQMGLILPAVSFATSILDGEWFSLLGTRGQHILNYASLESHRAHFGTHWGVRTRTLDPTPNPWNEEELMSITMLQDVFNRPSRALPDQLDRVMTLKGVYSDFGADDADWFGYWDNQAFVSSSHPSYTYASFFRRLDNNTVLLVVSNLGNADIGSGATVTLDLGALGLGAFSTGTMHSFDGTTQAVLVSGGTVTIGSLPKWTPRVIVLQ